MSWLTWVLVAVGALIAWRVLAALLRWRPHRPESSWNADAGGARNTAEAAVVPSQVSPVSTGDTRPLPGARCYRQVPSDGARLRRSGLPSMETTDDVLGWLGIDLGAFLALANPMDRRQPPKSNYIEWTVPKKGSGQRLICSPKQRLRAAQQRIKHEILDRVELHEAVHGFRRGHSIITNARPHIGQALIVNLDLRNFFEYVRYPRVIGVFRWAGYSLEVSRCLSLLCTHRPATSALPKDSVWHHYAVRPSRHAVQGAPTSPALANLAVARLDRRLSGLARKFEANYTRYADDLTFSGGEPFKRGMIRFLPLVRKIIRSEGFMLNAHKMRFMRPGQRQEVTGVVVNSRTNVRREEYDRLKAIIHNAAKAGSLESQNRDEHPDFRAYLLGRAAHVRQLNPERGQRLIEALRALN